MGSGCHRWADVKFDGTNYLVVWQTGDNDVGQIIYGQFIATDGSLVGSTFTISANTNLKRWWPALAVSDSNFLVVWDQGSSSDIWGNVDVNVTGITENVLENDNNSSSDPTIFAGAVKLFTNKPYTIYDAAGRQMKSDHLKPGIYFIEKEGRIRQKFIIVR